MKDFDIKVVQAGQDEENADADIVYANVVPSGDTYVNSFSDITLKLTTMNDKAQPSYSNVLYSYGGVTSPYGNVKERGSNVGHAPEENIITKYYDQYSTPTKKITIDLPYGKTETDAHYLTPFDGVIGVDVEEPNKKYVQLGTIIDFQYGRQTVTLEKVK